MRDHSPVRRAKVRKPFPDALEGGFTVVNGPGGVDLPGKVMRVPLGESDLDRATRLHEMGHIKFTPKDSPEKVARKHGITVDALQVCEDARVNTLLERAGLPMSRLGRSEDLAPWSAEFARVLASGNRAQAIQVAAEARVGFEGRNARGMEEILRDLGLHEAISLARRALSELHPKRITRAGGIPFTRTIRAAKVLSDGARQVADIGESPADFSEEMVESALESSVSFVPWGTMEILQPSRHARHGAKVAPRVRSTDVGQRLRHVSRVLTDGRIFSHRVRQDGGSLLIDGSGSMHMSAEQVQTILSIAPLAWVAIYGARTDHGWVKILAKDGKAVAPDAMRSPGGCNVIDGPALALLAKQSAPRIWICDGRVTGVGDRGAIGNVAECARTCTKANVRRIGTVEGAIDYLRSLARRR